MDQILDRSKIPVPTVPRPFNFPEFERFKMENGLEVMLAQHSKLPLVSMNLCMKTAALIDPKNKEGLANLTAELLTEGTKKRTSVDIANELEFIGANYGSHTDWNAVFVEINTLKKHLDKATDIFTDIILNPVFPEKELRRVKGELLTDRMRVVDSPVKIANERFAEMLYGDFRYGKPVEGTEESLNNITREDLRYFYKKAFIPDNATLILAGDINKKDAEILVKKYFSNWQTSKVPQIPEMKIKSPGKTSISLIHKPDAVQSELRIGHLGIDHKNPDFYPVTLLNEILGGYFLSRINMNLREEHGYTYGANSVFSYRKQTGPFYVAASVHTEYTTESVREVINEIQAIRTLQVSDEEIHNAKGYLIGVFPIAFETADQLAAGLANIVVFDLADDYYQTFRDRVSNVTKQDILHAAQKYLHPDQMHIVVTGDRQKIEEKLKQLYEVTVFDVNGNKFK